MRLAVYANAPLCVGRGVWFLLSSRLQAEGGVLTASGVTFDVVVLCIISLRDDFQSIFHHFD